MQVLQGNKQVLNTQQHTWDSCDAVLSPLKSLFKMLAQFPSPHFWTAAISSLSSASDHGFLFLRGGRLPLAVEACASNPSIVGVIIWTDCFWTETGITMFVPWKEHADCDPSRGALDDRPVGILIVNGASIVELFGTFSLGKLEAMSTWPMNYQSDEPALE